MGDNSLVSLVGYAEECWPGVILRLCPRSSTAQMGL